MMFAFQTVLVILGGGLVATSLYEVPKNVTVKDEKIEIDTKNKLVDLLKLTCDAYKNWKD
jgi:hypothetical protein